MKTIKLTRGYSAKVSDEDFEYLSQFKWQAAIRKRRVYASRTDVAGVHIYMHREILTDTPEVDHFDGDGLNNQRDNLRPSNRQLNSQSFRRKPAGCSSKFRGVSWDKRSKRWFVQIAAYGQRRSVGYFSDEVEAARAYDEAAKKLFLSSTSALNFPKP